MPIKAFCSTSGTTLRHRESFSVSYRYQGSETTKKDTVFALTTDGFPRLAPVSSHDDPSYDSAVTPGQLFAALQFLTAVILPGEVRVALQNLANKEAPLLPITGEIQTSNHE